MDKAATEVAKTSLGEDGASAGDLLRSASFLERLEHARAQRERVLAQRAQNPDSSNDLRALHKPWEKIAPNGQGKGTPVARPAFRDLVPFEKAAHAEPASEPAAHGILVSTPVADPAEQPQTERRKAFAGWRMSAGFAFGAVLGLTLTWAMPVLLDRGTGRGADDPVPPTSAVIPAPVAAGSVAPVLPEPTADSPAAIGVQSATAPATLGAAPATLVLMDAPPDNTVTAQSPAPPPLIAFVPPEGLAPTPPPLQPSGAPQFTDATPATVAPVGLGAITGADLPPVRQALAPVMQDVAGLAVASPDAPIGQPDLAALNIHILAPAGAPRDTTDALVATLTDAGYTATEATHVAVTVRQSHVRYYHAADAAAAQALAAMVGAKARDFTTIDPLPPVGLIEVWIAGETPEPVTKKKKTQKKKPPAAPKQSTSEQQQLQDLRDRLLKELQNGASP